MWDYILPFDQGDWFSFMAIDPNDYNKSNINWWIVMVYDDQNKWQCDELPEAPWE